MARGLANADEQTKQRVASAGGQAQGAENNPGNFANDHEKASRAGKEGAKAQPTEAKRAGGRNSHK